LAETQVTGVEATMTVPDGPAVIADLVRAGAGVNDFVREVLGHLVVGDHAIAVHGVEVELGRVHDEVVVQVLRVRHGLQQATATVQGDFGLAPVPNPRPGLGLLGGELHRDTAVRSDLGADAGCRDDAVVVTAGQVDPRAHLVGPGDDLAVVSLDAQRQSRLSGRLRGLPVPAVVLHAPNQRSNPARQD
jgi:hypothetical protein